MKMLHLMTLLLAFAATAVAAQPALENQARVIVSLKPGAATLRDFAVSRQQVAAAVHDMAQRRADVLSRHAGRALSAGRMLNARAQVITASGITSEALARQLAQHPEVAYAVVDRRRRALYVPNDPLFAAGPSSGLGPDAGQWYLRAPTAVVPAAINAEGAWDRVSANPSLVVAVLDTGVLSDHVDLSGRVLPGYDMISEARTANDSNGRDANASDPGDWITASEDADRRGFFYQCGAEDSSWHGTMTSGLIGAIADNGVGMAGAASGVRILPVRVLGKCGGYDSDILAGMQWAAGIEVPGVPANPNPARILNLSLGSSGSCEAAYVDVLQQLTSAGAVVVASGGNSAGHAVGSPANCPGVIAVAALRHAGSKVGFSDLGPEITISAPGGNCVNVGAGEPCLYPILTTKNLGTRAPVTGGSTWTDAYRPSFGTSFSAPLVAATVALMLSARPNLTPAQIIDGLKRGARPFPSSGASNAPDLTPVPMCHTPDGIDQEQCYCSTGLCGAGMLDALAAVQAVLTPQAPDELARQVMNYGERNFPQYFAQRPATQFFAPFSYRYYADTGIYLGVVVQSGSAYVTDGVYVMGGPFGDAPRLVGMVKDFVRDTLPPVPGMLANKATAGR